MRSSLWRPRATAKNLKIWSEVAGKRATFVECSIDDYVGIWGPGGEELAA